MAMEALRIAAKESKFMKFILGGFIALAAGGLVFTDVHGFFTGNPGGTTVARVNDTKIDIRQFDSKLRGFLAQTGLDSEQAYQLGLVHNFLQSRVNVSLRQDAAQDLNLRLDNETIANQIRSIFGENVSRDQIEMSLRAQGLTAESFAQNLRAQSALTLLNSLPGGVINHTPNYTRNINSLLSRESRSATIYTIPLSRLAKDHEVTEDEITAYYAAHAPLSTIPEQRVFNVGTMTLEMAKANLPAITDTDIRAEYDARPDDFTIPEQRTIVQIQVSNPDEAQAIYESALDNGDLTLGNDGASAPAAFTFDGLPEDLADLVFSETTEIGDVLPPVPSIFGYVVAQVTAIKPERIRPYDEIKTELSQDMQDNAIFDALYNKMVDAEDMADAGQSYSEIAGILGLETSETAALDRSNLANITGALKTAIESGPSLIDEIFNLPEGAATYPVEIDDSSFIIVGVQSITPETLQPLADVRDDILATLRDQQRETAAETRLQSLIAELQSGTLTDNDLKNQYRARIRTNNNLSREDASTRTADLIFATDNNMYDYFRDDDSMVMVHVTDIRFDTSDTNTATDAASFQSAQDQIIDALLTHYWRDNATIRINDALLERQYATVR